MPPKRTRNSIMLYFGLVVFGLALAGCGGTSRHLDPVAHTGTLDEIEATPQEKREIKAKYKAELAAQAAAKRRRDRPKPKPHSEHLTSAGWKQLGKELYFTLEVGGGTRMLAALRTEAEDNCRSEEAPCYHEIGSTMVQRMIQARSTVRRLEAAVEPGLCREGLEQAYRTFDAPLLRAQEFQAGHASEFLWEETERELEGPLTIEHNEEGRSQLVVQSMPLADCDPSGTGKIMLGGAEASE